MTITLIVLFIAIVMMAIELAYPAQPWPQVGGWWLRATLLNVFQVGMVFVSGIAWNDWMLQHRLWSADALGPAWGGIVGYTVITFIYYWWHRWRHESLFLWRWIHQVHHSPQRIEIITSFYKHPFELLIHA